MLKRTLKLYLISIIMTAIGSILITMAVHAKELAEVPEEVIAISEELGAQYNICPELLQSIGFCESGYRADAVNGDCIGIMQISEKWHKDRMKRLGVTNLFDIRQNMTVAADYLAELAEKYEDVAVALMVYNGDSGANEVLSGTGNISRYAEKVLELSAALEELHGK